MEAVATMVKPAEAEKTEREQLHEDAAEVGHTVWLRTRLADSDTKFNFVRNDSLKQHPALVPFDFLTFCKTYTFVIATEDQQTEPLNKGEEQVRRELMDNLTREFGRMVQPEELSVQIDKDRLKIIENQAIQAIQNANIEELKMWVGECVKFANKNDNWGRNAVQVFQTLNESKTKDPEFDKEKYMTDLYMQALQFHNMHTPTQLVELMKHKDHDELLQMGISVHHGWRIPNYGNLQNVHVFFEDENLKLFHQRFSGESNVATQSSEAIKQVDVGLNSLLDQINTIFVKYSIQDFSSDFNLLGKEVNDVVMAHRMAFESNSENPSCITFYMMMTIGQKVDELLQKIENVEVDIVSQESNIASYNYAQEALQNWLNGYMSWQMKVDIQPELIHLIALRSGIKLDDVKVSEPRI